MYRSVILLILFMSFGFTYVALGQKEFEKHYSDGLRFERQKNLNAYNNAETQFIFAFETAESIDERRRAKDALIRVKDKRNNLFNALLRGEQDAKNQLERSLDSIQILNDSFNVLNDSLSQLLTDFKSNEYAALSSKEIEAGNFGEGLNLAYLSFRLVEDNPNLGIKRSFGEAVWRTLSDTLVESKSISMVTAISPNGKYVATVSKNNNIDLWQKETEKSFNLISPLKGHQGIITSLLYSSDNRFLVSTSEDATAML